MESHHIDIDRTFILTIAPRQVAGPEAPVKIEDSAKWVFIDPSVSPRMNRVEGFAVEEGTLTYQAR